jgi:protein-tyrosine phosphatase
VASYNDLARKISYCLTSGENVHLHCAPGNGRTGTFAMAIALAMGLTPEEGR